MLYNKRKELDKLFEKHKEDYPSTILALHLFLKMTTDSIYEIFMKAKSVDEFRNKLFDIPSTIFNYERATESEKVLFNLLHRNKEFFSTHFKSSYKSDDNEIAEKEFTCHISVIITMHVISIRRRACKEIREQFSAAINSSFEEKKTEDKKINKKINSIAEEKEPETSIPTQKMQGNQ